jgi:integrase
MTSISRLPSGKYRVRWRESGRQVASAAVKTRLEAEVMARRIEQDLARAQALRQDVQAGRMMPLEAVIERYCLAGVSTGRMGQGRAWEVRRGCLRFIAERGWTTTAAITAESLDRWRIEAATGQRGDNPARYLLAVLRWASGPPLRQVVDPGLFVLRSPRRPRKGPPPLLSESQVGHLIILATKAGGEVAGAAIEHLATYGCRPVELCRLQVQDLSPAGVLTHRTTKNAQPVSHPLLPHHRSRYAALASGMPPENPLFPSPDGDFWWLGSRGQAAELTNWYRDRCSTPAGLPVSQRGIYCLKDYAISRMESAGIDDRTKALFTGHQTLAVFARYKATNHDRATAALDRLARCDTA